MANYENIIDFTLEYEGFDKCTDIKEDRGGITKYGVSLLFAKGTKNLHLFDIDSDGDIDREDIKLVTEDIAKVGFKKYFWDNYKLDDIDSDKKAFVLFDASMNHGNGNSIVFLQKTLYNIGYDCDVDKMFGPKTFSFLKDAPVDEFCEEFLRIRENFYYRIVERNPSQRKFIKGWINRINKVKRDLNTLDN